MENFIQSAEKDQSLSRNVVDFPVSSNKNDLFSETASIKDILIQIFHLLLSHNEEIKKAETRNKIDDVMTVEDVANLFRCTPKRVYSIPHSELPRASCGGRSDLFLAEDIKAYIRSCKKSPSNHEDVLDFIDTLADKHRP